MVQNTNNGGQSAEFVYNAEGKRVVYLRNGQETRYLYDGWNVLGEYDTANMLKNSYLWGTDLSATEQGAGGVGGLLACRDVSQNSVADDTGTGAGASFYYHYDGNGNVTKLTDASGNVRASYDYSPFGRVIAQSGNYANENKYRFSTKPYENVSETYYYGFRFYNAEVGRWLNRDPIEESGGVNLYGFVGNNGVNNFDLLGELTKKCCEDELKGSKGNKCCVRDDEKEDSYYSVDRKPTKTCVKECKALAYNWSQYKIEHIWVESCSGKSIGAVASGNIFYSNAAIEDYYKNNKDKKCEPIELSQCSYNVSKFQDEVDKEITRIKKTLVNGCDITFKYSFPFNDCGEYADRVINKAKSKSMRK